MSFRALIKSGLKIRTVLLEEKNVEKFQKEIEDVLTKERLEVWVSTRAIISEIVGFRFHQGVLALAECPKNVPFEKLELPAVALNRIEKSENVGALIRTAVGFGIESFVIDAGSCDPFVRKALRCAMGASLFCKFSFVKDLAESFTSKSDIKILAIEQGINSVPLSECLPEFDIIVFGNEASGISDNILALSNQIIEIPINSKHVQSFNLAVAAGIVMSRQAR